MKLQEKIKNYTRPVDEDGWEAISSDPTLVRYNRGRLVRRVCAYGIPALVVTSHTRTSTRHSTCPDDGSNHSPCFCPPWQ